MEFDKHDRANSILKELVATFIREEANTDPLITVTHVGVSPSYKNVVVYVTTIPDTEEKERDALIFLKRNGGEIRNYLKKNARLKYIPNIEFAIDYGERHRQHIDEISREIHKEKAGD